MSKAGKAVVDWTRIFSSYGLGKETLTSISAFRKRASDAATANALLKETKRVNGIDFSHYRSVLKNQAIVDELEQAVTKFKPVTTDASKEIKAIEAFEVKAIADAEETIKKIDAELVDLNRTAANIPKMRSFDDLTMQEFSDAIPGTEQTVEIMVSKGKFSVPGYKEKFGDLNML